MHVRMQRNITANNAKSHFLCHSKNNVISKITIGFVINNY